MRRDFVRSSELARRRILSARFRQYQCIRPIIIATPDLVQPDARCGCVCAVCALRARARRRVAPVVRPVGPRGPSGDEAESLERSLERRAEARYAACGESEECFCRTEEADADRVDDLGVDSEYRKVVCLYCRYGAREDTQAHKYPDDDAFAEGNLHFAEE